MTSGMKIFVIALCIYFIIGAWRYRTIDQGVLEDWRDAADAHFRKNLHKHPRATKPSRGIADLMFFSYVLFFWFNTIGMKPLRDRTKEEDHGDS